MDNTCVCCGEIIPEGTQVCPKCLEGDTFAAVMSRKIPAEENINRIYIDSENHVDKSAEQM